MPARTRRNTARALQGCGEDRLVEDLLAALPPARHPRRIVAGSGADDCAIVRLPGMSSVWQLLKTDCIVEGVHFAPETEPVRVGWKALCRPLSDIASSGGRPQHALVTFALSPRASARWAMEVYDGIARAAIEFAVDVVGGETVATPGPSFLSICVTGSVRPEECVTRQGGKADDLLYVTGSLGGSFASGRHLDFRPRLEEARWLVSRYRPHAMMDLSDGLAADLPRMARSSGTGYAIEPEALPRSKGCTVEQALGDGEDYELLLAVSPRDASRLPAAWKRKFPQVPLTLIGHLAERGRLEGLGRVGGYDHFA